MDKPRLGRGLDALLGGADAPSIPEAATIETGEVAIGQIVQNPYQPRKHFDHDQLAALSAPPSASTASSSRSCAET